MIGAVAIGLLLFVMQHVLFVGFTIFGVHPELLLLYAVCCGLANGSNFGVIAGFVAGLVSDAFMTSPLGLGAFAFASAGYIAGILSDDTTSTPIATATSAATSSAAGLFFLTVFGLITHEIHISIGHMFVVLLIASLLNGLLALPAVRALRSLNKQKDLAW